MSTQFSRTCSTGSSRLHPRGFFRSYPTSRCCRWSWTIWSWLFRWSSDTTFFSFWYCFSLWLLRRCAPGMSWGCPRLLGCHTFWLSFSCWGPGVCRRCVLWGLALYWCGAVCTRAPGPSWLWETRFFPFLPCLFLCGYRRDQITYVSATPTSPICSCMAACYIASEYHDLYLFFQPPPGLGSSVNYPLSPQCFEVISCRHVSATGSKKSGRGCQVFILALQMC